MIERAFARDHRRFSFLILLLLCTASAHAQVEIRVNQLGYYPSGPKVAAVVGGAGGTFEVVRGDDGEVASSGLITAGRTWAPSGEVIRLADFSELHAPGRYHVRLEDGTTSAAFTVGNHVHQPLAEAAIKGFYFQRASFRLRTPWAGPWARLAGHPDTQVLVHPSAATANRPANSTISAPKGWYDAGDYNKYVVNSGIATYTLLAAYEHYSDYVRSLNVDIPESGGALPDVLAEALWNLEWMLAMQDPHDGGVYHKLTSANFSGYVMPHGDTATRYVVQKSTAASLDFAAVMAQASRIFRDYEAVVPGLPDSMEAAAVAAWAWARTNPSVFYNQSAMNLQHSPAIHTGEYGDFDVSDEFAWVAMELHVTTRADSFLTVVHDFVSGSGSAPLPGWPQVRTLGYYSLLHHRNTLGSAARAADVQARVLALANTLRQRHRNSPMSTSMEWGDFYWGSNSVAANQGMALMQAFRITGDSTYLDVATAALDYLLGRNGVGMSFVTGQGELPARHPHHRPSIAGAYSEPVPGLLVGGPNPGREDAEQCAGYGAAGQYPSTLPAKAYLDHHCSYASNEIAINWNAPLAYLAVALEATMSADGLPVSIGHDEAGAFSDHLSIRSIYPQPSAGLITVEFDMDRASEVTFDLFDLLGRRVLRMHSSQGGRGRGSIVLDAAGFPSAAYILRMGSEGTFVSKLIVIAR
jgi:endoglucanase